MYHHDYDNIQMIEQLRPLMTLDANMNTSDIEERECPNHYIGTLMISEE